MKIFLTGSSGMVGRNILASPLAAQHEILAPDRNALDLFVYDDIVNYIQSHQPDFVIHCAGTVGGILANMNAQTRFLTDNLEMGKNLVMAAKACNIKKLINLGSSCIYPKDIKNPLREDALLTGKLEPTNEGYALAKLVILKLCKFISDDNQSLQYKTLLPCNLYGPHDKFDPLQAHMIPSVVRKLHEAKECGKDCIDIWGSGHARREFMYSQDLADFIFFAIDHFDKVPDIMNVGLGYDYSINEYYEIIGEIVGYRGTYVHDTSKPEGMKQKLLDVSLQREVGWRPETSLENGIAKTYAYFLDTHK